MYMPYLMYGYAVALALMLLGCRVANRAVPGLRGIRLLAAALGCALVAVLLISTRPWAPAWITILLGNGALFASSVILYCGTADALALPMRFLPWGVDLGVAALAADAWLTWVHPSLTLRILITSGYCAVCAAATAWLLFRHNSRTPESALRHIITMLARLECLLACVCTARGVLTVLDPPADFIRLGLVQGGFTYLHLLLYAGNGAGLIWLALYVQRRELQLMAGTDSLTGLLNRRAFEDILERELERIQGSDGSLAVLLLDIDHFKKVNDAQGHSAGDEVLRRVCGALQTGTRPMDAVARYGGEEFVMLVRGRTLEQAEEMAERLRADIAALIRLPGGLKVTASIGVAASAGGDTPEEILRRCDEALYESKRGGRNRVTASRVPHGSAG
jgi:diguanylate cyclase (GGDEF)-like protein